MESVTSRVCDKLELIKTDLHLLIQSGSTEKALKTNLFCAIKLYEEIANNKGNVSQREKSRDRCDQRIREWWKRYERREREEEVTAEQEIQSTRGLELRNRFKRIIE